MRKYSIDEIDRMRLLLRGRMEFGVDTREDEAALEARVRTYLTASLDPEDLAPSLRAAIVGRHEHLLAEASRHTDGLRRKLTDMSILKTDKATRYYGLEPVVSEEDVQRVKDAFDLSGRAA